MCAVQVYWINPLRMMNIMSAGTRSGEWQRKEHNEGNWWAGEEAQNDQGPDG